MNPIEKPKGVKLWKKQKTHKQNTDNLKMKVKSDKSEEMDFEESVPKLKAEKKHKKGVQDDNKITSEDTNNVSTIKTNGEAKESGISNTSGDNKKLKSILKKRKNEFEDSNSKKMKPDGLTEKQSKKHRLNKKNKVKDSNLNTDTSAETKKKDMKVKLTKKEFKKRKMEKKGKSKIFEIAEILKKLWEDLRREVTTPEKKDQLLKQACDLLKGRVKEFTFAHDTVRVLECILREGAETHRNLLFEELKNDILPLSKSKYGKYFVQKLLKYGTKEQKVAVMKTFHGQIVQLIRHAEASEVVELAFNECANAAQRFEFVQEFFNPSYKFFKTQDVSSLEELFEKEPSKKASIIQHMKEELLKILDKTVIKHSMVHNVLWQFIRNADPESRAEVIESVRDVVHEILHTKDGSRVGMHCVWHGTIKDRKVIVRSMKTFVAKIAMEEHGHMVLLALFDCLDDTAIMEKIVIKELVSQLFELSQNIHGKKVLIYLLNPRDPHYIHPDVINILKQGDGNKTSKKDPKIRSSQLKSMIATPLLDMIKSNISKLYIENSFCLFALVILQHTVGNRKEAFQSIVDLVVEPYTTENKKHAIENPGSHFMFKQLITRDKEESNDNVKFSEVLIETVPKLVFKSWMDCNRGAFLLVGLLETELPTVVERIKQELDGCLSSLKKKSYAGANILIKKLE